MTWLIFQVLILCDTNLEWRKFGSSIITTHLFILCIWFRLFQARHNLALFCQAPSPNMAFLQFLIGHKAESAGDRSLFESWEDSMHNVMTQQHFIPKEAFLKCFQHWQRTSKRVAVIFLVNDKMDTFWTDFMQCILYIITLSSVDARWSPWLLTILS